MRCPFCDHEATSFQWLGDHVNAYHRSAWWFDHADMFIVCCCGWRTSLDSQVRGDAFLKHLVTNPDDHLLHYRLGGKA